MAFIEKKDPVVINIKLTSKGRELLSEGNLNFQYFAIGDSEIDYNFISEAQAVDSEFTAYNLGVLRPADKNPKQLSFITKTLSGDPYNQISSVPSSPYIVSNTVDSLGFFTNITNTQATFITDANHVKQPDAMIDMGTIAGGKQLTLLKAPTYGTSTAEPAIGDMLLVKWTYGFDTTGQTVQRTLPTPYLFYRIENKLSGTLASNNLVVEVDRELPNFTGLATSGVYAGALIYYDFINFSGNTVFTMSSTDYLDESVLSFLQNSQCPTIVFPFWNMSIIFTEEIAGVTAEKLKYTQFNSRTYAGFVSYIQNQAPVYKKLGVIHYTNSSPANVYAEGFYLNTPVLKIPTIMWHKSTGATLGVTLRAYGSPKLLVNSNTGATSLDTEYYDLADEDGNVVGKVFTELKLFVIEDQELLFAMSYKSNRSWTLPNYYASTSALPDCPPMSPIVMWKPITIITPTLTVVSREYCHSTSGGWKPITGTSTVYTLAGVKDTGYRVGVCNGALVSGSVSIGRYHIVDDTIMCTYAPVSIAPNSCCAVTVTYTHCTSCTPPDYYFNGTAS